MTINILMTEVSSSQISEIGYHDQTNTLAIRFRKKGEPGPLYHYPNFPPDLHAEFLGAESKGVFFGRHIRDAKGEDGKPLYPHTRINETEDSNAE